MNSRIKELAEIAKPVDQNNQVVRGLNSEYHNIWMEKFAELIIKECLQFIEPMPGSGDMDDVALESATKEIKEHFGVK